MGWVSGFDVRSKAPATVAILVTAVGLAIAAAAYFVLRDALHDHAASRLVTLQTQYRETYRNGMTTSRERIAEAASQPALAAYLSDRVTLREAEALAAMIPPGPAPEWVVRVELRDPSGLPLLIVPGHPAQAKTEVTTLDAVDGESPISLASSNGLEIAYGKLTQDGDSILFPIVARIGNPASGYLVVWRRVATTWQAAQQVATVMGDEAAVYMVNADGSLWSQFGKPVVGLPEPPVLEGVTVYDRAGTGRVLSAAGPMESTPWAFVFEFPEATVQAPAQIFLRAIAWIAPVFILVGTLVAWRMTRRLTDPLHELTKAADAIASGHLSYRAQVTREDELGRLSTAFNTMAAEVEESRTRLESLVEERTLTLASIGDGVITTDTDGRVAFMNPVAEFLTGWTERDALRQPLDSVCPLVNEHTGETVESPATKALRDGSVVGIADNTVLITKDGNKRPIDDTAAPIRNQQGQVIGCVLVFRDITERRQAERARRDRELLERLVRSQEAERQRIARDLHDHLGQQLTGVRLALADLHQCSKDSPTIRKKVAIAQDRARDLDRDVGLLAFQLRGSSLKENGLTVELENLVSEWSRNYQVPAEFHVAGARKNGRLPDEVEIHLYRIAQEALNNTVKHAKATNVSVVLNVQESESRLLIEDNGIGFDLADKPDPSSKGHGMGLIGMQERADLLGADLEIDSQPGVGTTVFVTIRNSAGTIKDSRSSRSPTNPMDPD